MVKSEMDPKIWTRCINMKGKRFSAQPKAKLAPEATGGEGTTGQIAKRLAPLPSR